MELEFNNKSESITAKDIADVERKTNLFSRRKSNRSFLPITEVNQIKRYTLKIVRIMWWISFCP